MTHTPPAPSVPLDQPDPNISFGDAFKRFWKKGFTFTGRASRREFWLAYVATAGVGFVLYMLATVVTASASTSAAVGFGGFLLLIAMLYLLACAIPSIAVSVRRLHDADKPGVMYLIAFLPFGGIVLLVFFAQEPNPAGARFDLPSGAGYSPHLGAASAQGYIAPPPPPAPNFQVPVAAPPAPAPAFGAPVPPPPAPPAPPAPNFQLPPVAPPAPNFQAPPAPPMPVAPPPQLGPISSVPGVSAPPAPSAPAYSPPPAAPAFTKASDDDALDSTRLSAPVAGWAAVLPDGRTIPLARPLLFGRDPGSNPSYPDAVLVPIDDPAKSMSKTHAVILVEEGSATVTDLHSTNGTKLGVDGGLTSLAPGVASRVSGSEASVVFGDYAITLRRNG